LKRKVITITLLFMFIFNICAASAFADDNSLAEEITENTETTVEVEIDNGEGPAQVIIIDVDPGTTPDETFYSIKRLFENVQLFLTFSAEDKAALLTEFAEKRLAEAQVMDEAGKLELVKDMVEEYAAALLKAQKKAEEVVIDGLSIQEIVKQIEKLLDDNIEILNKVKSELPELERNLNSIKENLVVIKTISETIKQLEEEQDDTDANVDEQEEENDEEDDEDVVVKEKTEEKKVGAIFLEGLTVQEQIKALRDAGYGYGEISLALALVEKADVSIDDIVEMRNNGLGWGNVTKELGLHRRDVAKKIGKMVLESKKDFLEAKEETEEDEKLEEIDEENIDLKQLLKKQREIKLKETEVKREMVQKKLR